MKKKSVFRISLVAATVLILAASLFCCPSYRGSKNTTVWGASDPFDIFSDTVIIQKDPEKEFVILNFADIQICDADKGAIDEVFTLMDILVEEVKPDLITLTGDQIMDLPMPWNRANKKAQDRLAAKLDSYQVKWAPVLGNHDSTGLGSVKVGYVADVYANAEYSVFRKGPGNIGGWGNYIINIMEGESVVQTLYMMDSNNYSGKHFKQAQLDWYAWAVEGMKAYNDGEVTSSMLFMHIPFPEYKDAYEYWKDSGFDTNIGNGWTFIETEYLNTEGRGVFDTFRDLSSTKYVFCGHNHNNDYSIWYQGVNLNFCVKTGDRSYYTPELQGGTAIYIGEGVRIERINKGLGY